MAQSFLQVAKRVTVKSIYTAGILFFGGLLLLLILTILPKNNFRTEAFYKLRSEWVKFLNYLEKKTSSPNTPDSPIVVRGGSINLDGDMGWAPTDKNSNAYVSKLTLNNNEVPADTLSLDGFDVSNTKIHPVHINDMIQDGNWIVTLDYREGTGGQAEDGKTIVQICTSMDAARQSCLVDNKKVNSTVYFLAQDAEGTFLDKKMDGVPLVDRPGEVYFDLLKCSDPKPAGHPYCDHPFDAWLTTSTGKQRIGHCVDGACSIGITSTEIP